MDREKTFLDYCGIALTQFGFTIAVLNLFCVFVGEMAKEHSAMFRLGGAGLAVPVVFQFLVLSFLITFLRVLFFTDKLIRKMSIVVRGCGMVVCTILLIAVFVVLFQWFPVGEATAWVMFLVCFGLSMGGTMIVLTWKEKLENQKMERALKKIQGETNE